MLAMTPKLVKGASLVGGEHGSSKGKLPCQTSQELAIS